tara:strand:- start:847 stop:1083 length:237 start_codon:yes stop_codon:yes gene_type:complete
MVCSACKGTRKINPYVKNSHLLNTPNNLRSGGIFKKNNNMNNLIVLNQSNNKNTKERLNHIYTSNTQRKKNFKKLLIM